MASETVGALTMALDFRNRNTLWASILVETLFRLGLKTALICPGSRSAPLAIAFAQHPHLEALPILDERSAAFFGLGIARRTRIPVALVCTSGTAGANFFPAVIEARESRVPLLVLTADRPPELRHCHAGQAIQQVNFYGGYPTWQAELALPTTDTTQLTAQCRYLRQTVAYAWERSQWPVAGPVHLNVPFQEPLAPTPDPTVMALAPELDESTFWQMTPSGTRPPSPTLPELPLDTWQACDRGLIVAGPAIPDNPEAYCIAIAQLAHLLGWPVLAEALSPLRNRADCNPTLISTYDIILRQESLAQILVPQQVIRIGELPTSKVLRQWLQANPAPQWIIEPSDHNVDPIHSHSHPLRTSIEAIAPQLTPDPVNGERAPTQRTPYSQTWITADARIRQLIHKEMTATTQLHEGKVAWLLSQSLPHNTRLHVANSMPIRDVEAFWQPSNRGTQPAFSRGANGIDGTLSTALGMAHQQPPSVLLTGDLSLLHDTNGFLIQPQWQGSLTIVLLNNQGGGIFHQLPIAQFDPPFEAFFATPQRVSFEHLCQTYGIDYHRITAWAHLQTCLATLPTTGIQVLEVPCDRTRDSQWRKIILRQMAAALADFKTADFKTTEPPPHFP